MERQSSPELRVVSPDSNQDTGTTFNTDDTDHSAMAAMVAHPNPSNMPGPANIGGVNKRYRPAPAKTFQCKGFGDCRMVFSRSEHLARHIRKHTGERPFTCHCSKQFSRLDNLRQHAQTVHADKQDQNERMMRELTSLHASMAAANKAGGRGGRRASGALSQQQSLPPAGSSPSSNGHSSPHHSPVSVNDGLNLIKEEDPTLSLHQRQDSQQYDANGLIYHNQTPSSWGVHGADSLHPRPSSRNGFRHDAADAFHSQSYLSYSPPLSFGLQGGDAPRSRPGTASGKGAHSLPPLSAIIPDQQEQSLHEYQQQQMAHQQQQQQGYVPSAIRPRPGTSSGRPPSSGASLFGPGTGPPKQQAGFYGDFNQRSYPTLGGYDTDSANSSSQDSNPFYFQHDDSSSTSGRSPSASSARSQSTALTPPANYQVPTSVSASRKRPFDGPDGPYNDLTYPSHPPPPQQPGGGPFAYEYGSESRPQSRRLSVLELCNDGESTPGANSMLHADAMFGMNMNGLGGMGMNGINGLGVGVGVGGMNGFLEGRPTTAQIVSSASALAIFDGRDHSRSPSGSSVASAQHIGPGHHGAGPDRRRASPAASTRSHGSGGRQSVRPDRPGRTTPPSRKVTPTVAAAGGAYSHASPAQGYHQPAHLSQQFSQPYSQPPYSSPYQNHANLNMNIPLGVYPSQASPTFSSTSAASTPVTSFPSIQQQYLTGHGHHPHPQVQHLQQQHGRVGSPLSTSTQGASSPGPRSPGVPVSPFVGQSSFAMHQQQYLQQHQGGHGPYGQGF